MPAFERTSPDGPTVESVGTRGFVVDGRAFPALLLTPASALEWHPPGSVKDLQAADFETLLALDPKPEFILLGTGAGMTFAPRALRQTLDDQGVGLEVMDSRAAARTWAVLRAEERWIAAALMPL